jgi:hypothetical protein
MGCRSRHPTPQRKFRIPVECPWVGVLASSWHGAPTIGREYHAALMWKRVPQPVGTQLDFEASVEVGFLGGPRNKCRLSCNTSYFGNVTTIVVTAIGRVPVRDSNTQGPHHVRSKQGKRHDVCQSSIEARGQGRAERSGSRGGHRNTALGLARRCSGNLADRATNPNRNTNKLFLWRGREGNKQFADIAQIKLWRKYRSYSNTKEINANYVCWCWYC